MSVAPKAIELAATQPQPSMEYQPDWERVRQRMLAFWEREIVDRVMIWTSAPRPDVPPPPRPTPTEAAAHFFDVEYQINRQRAILQSTYFAGDALPYFHCSTVAFAFSSILGGTVQVIDGEPWADPIANFWESPQAQLRAQWDGPMWIFTEALLRRCIESARGKCAVRLMPMNQGMDALSALMTPQQLCLDLVDRPEQVAQALERIRWAWCLVYESLWREGARHGAVLTDTMPVWHPGRYGTLQCDFMVMINRELFRRFVVPDLRSCSAYLDKTFFHLDGLEATHHLDALLEIETIQAIQFQQGTHVGNVLDSALPFIPMFRRIQQAGKSLWVGCQRDEMETLLRELSSRGLILWVDAATEDEARAIVKVAERLTHD